MQPPCSCCPSSCHKEDVNIMFVKVSASQYEDDEDDDDKTRWLWANVFKFWTFMVMPTVLSFPILTRRASLFAFEGSSLKALDKAFTNLT